MLENPHIGEGTLEIHEVNADALFAEIEQRTAKLTLNGPSLDDLDWRAILEGEGE